MQFHFSLVFPLDAFLKMRFCCVGGNLTVSLAFVPCHGHIFDSRAGSQGLCFGGFFFFLRYLFIFGCAGPSPVRASGGCFLVAVYRLFAECLFSCCRTWTLERRISNTGLFTPWHVGSSRTRDRTSVPCIGRWVLNHGTTREAQGLWF